MYKISHVGIKVKDITKSAKFYEDLLGCEFFRSFGDENLKAMLLKCGDNVIELIEENSREIIRGDGVIEHIAFKVDNIDAEVSKLKEMGIQCISSEIEDFEGIRLFFFRGPDGEMLEFIE